MHMQSALEGAATAVPIPTRNSIPGTHSGASAPRPTHPEN